MSETSKIIELLREKAPGQKISCAEARKLAEDLGVQFQDVGQACDDAGIKIFACELGCF